MRSEIIKKIRQNMTPEQLKQSKERAMNMAKLIKAGKIKSPIKSVI